MAVAATAYFAGQESGAGFSYTNAWGTRPSVVQIVAPLSFGSVGEVGDVTIRRPGQRDTVLRQCRMARINASRSTSQGGTVAFLIEDRRWKWQYGGYVDGDYNVRQPDGTRLREKSVKELAGLLFDALGEKEPLLDGLPDNVYPRAEWHAASPRQELERLTASLGCVVTLNIQQNRAEVHKIGEGADPINEPTATVSRADAATVLPPPDGMRVVGGQALFQSVCEFREALGIETDGSLKPIDELSYKPAGGWEQIDPTAFDAIEGTFSDAADNERKLSDLAREGVYRIYRLTGVNGGWSPAALQGGDYEPTGIDDIYPLLNVRLETDEETKERLPAVARGVFADLRYADKNSKPSEPYPGGYSIDPETRTITLSDPAVKYVNDDDPTRIEPAELDFICAYGVLHEGVPVRYEKFRTADGETYGAGELIEHHEDLVREVIDEDAQIGFPQLDNLEEVESQADYYLDALADQFVPRPALTVTIANLRPLSPDGVLRSVGWSFSTGQPPMTQLAYNGEPNPYLEPWETRKERKAAEAAEEAARREGQRSRKRREARP